MATLKYRRVLLKLSGEALLGRASYGLDDAALNADYPMGFAAGPLRNETFLLHLATHLAYHLGQIDMHRRTVCEGAGTVATVPIDALFVELPKS